jgi:hypothetical protein
LWLCRGQLNFILEESIVKRAFLPAFLLLALPALSQTGAQWVLVRSTLTYHMSHPMHQVDGISHGAKGKGTCHDGACDFLIAAPVNSFDSGDSNRDLHMVQVTRGAQFPMVLVRTRLPEVTPPSGTIYADLEVQFAGQTVHYNHVPFQKTTNGKDVQITGTVPSTCTDFKIDPPSFLTIAIKNEIPVRVEATWQPM